MRNRATPRRPPPTKANFNRVLQLRMWSRHLIATEGEDRLRNELRLANSYSRLGAVMALAAAPDFLALLREHWCGCDNIIEWRKSIAAILHCAKRDGLFPLPAPDSDAEAAATFDALPDVVTAYRGAYESNGKGFCYSLNRATAAKFPFLMRYRQRDPRHNAEIYEVCIHKSDIAFIVCDRQEQEVVVHPSDVTLMSFGLAWDALDEGVRSEYARSGL